MAAASATPAPWELQVVPQALADQFGAKCLDGSPPFFYWSRGAGVNGTKWRIHLRGGGWCTSANDCATRSQGFYGSSKG